MCNENVGGNAYYEFPLRNKNEDIFHMSMKNCPGKHPKFLLLLFWQYVQLMTPIINLLKIYVLYAVALKQ